MSWILLITTLPTQHTAVRQRTWRALKAAGAATLRDGVYLLPAQPAGEAAFEAIAADLQQSGGHAQMLRAQPPEGTDFTPLFNRAAAWKTLQADVRADRDLSAALAKRTQRSPARRLPGGACLAGQSPPERRARDQIRLKLLPSSSSKRLAKIGAVKLGSSSLTER